MIQGCTRNRQSRRKNENKKYRSLKMFPTNIKFNKNKKFLKLKSNLLNQWISQTAVFHDLTF